MSANSPQTPITRVGKVPASAGLRVRAERPEKQAAIALVVLGLMGFLYLFPQMMAFALDSLTAAHKTIQWTGVSAFLKSVWELLRHGTSGHRYGFVVWIFGSAYCVMLWQWIAFVRGWRGLVAPRRLWALSTGFFLTTIVAFGAYTRSSSDPRIYEDWLWVTLLFCMIPGAFLAIIIPLWRLSVRDGLLPASGSSEDDAQTLLASNLSTPVGGNDSFGDLSRWTSRDSEVAGAGCLAALGLPALAVALVIQVIRYDDNVSVTIGWCLFVVYCVLLFQWIIFALTGRALFASRWLWAASAAFFVAVLFTIACHTYESSRSWAVWLVGTFWISVIPEAFFAITLRLWFLSTRHIDGSTNAHTD